MLQEACGIAGDFTLYSCDTMTMKTS